MNTTPANNCLDGQIHRPWRVLRDQSNTARARPQHHRGNNIHVAPRRPRHRGRWCTAFFQDALHRACGEGRVVGEYMHLKTQPAFHSRASCRSWDPKAEMRTNGTAHTHAQRARTIHINTSMEWLRALEKSSARPHFPTVSESSLVVRTRGDVVPRTLHHNSLLTPLAVTVTSTCATFFSKKCQKGLRRKRTLDARIVSYNNGSRNRYGR